MFDDCILRCIFIKNPFSGSKNKAYLNRSSSNFKSVRNLNSLIRRERITLIVTLANCVPVWKVQKFYKIYNKKK